MTNRVIALLQLGSAISSNEYAQNLPVVESVSILSLSLFTNW